MWKTVRVPVSRGKARHNKRNRSRVQVTKRIPAKPKVLASLGWTHKTKFSQSDIQLYEQACHFQIYQRDVIRELIYQSSQSFLVTERDWLHSTAYFVNQLVDRVFKQELQIQRPSRYQFNKDSAHDGLKRLRNIPKFGFWDDTLEVIQQVSETYQTEICPVCLEPLLSPTGHKTKMCCLGQTETPEIDYSDYIDTLSCGHHIHNKCLRKMYDFQKHQNYGSLISCPLCRHTDPAMRYNHILLKNDHRERYQDCLDELQEPIFQFQWSTAWRRTQREWRRQRRERHRGLQG